MTPSHAGPARPINSVGHCSRSRLIASREADTAGRISSTDQYARGDIDIPELRIDQFKIADHLMAKEQKQIMKKLRAKFKTINDEFLSHFEKRYIVFIEEGTDLVKDLNLFNR